MRFLFVHQNFPGQYAHLARRLAASGRHDVLFVTQPNANRIPGVRLVEYLPHRSSTPGIHPGGAELEAAAIRAESVAMALRQLRELGFRPDVVIGHNGWGELLNVRDVWRDVPIIAYFEFFYHAYGLDLDFDPEFPASEAMRATARFKNAVNLLGLEAATLGHTPTTFQHGTYPAWARERIRVVPEGVDLDLCRPDATAVFHGKGRSWRRDTGRPLLTFVARSLEPYRGIHVFLRAISSLLQARDDFDVALVGSPTISYGAAPPQANWRDIFLASLPAPLPAERVFFLGHLPYDEHLRCLQASTIHTYLTYPFVASWSLREALACGCTVVGSDTAPVREFVEHGANGVLVPFHDPQGLAAQLDALLDDAPRRRALGEAAAERARRELPLAHHLQQMHALIRAAGVPLD